MRRGLRRHLRQGVRGAILAMCDDTAITVFCPVCGSPDVGDLQLVMRFEFAVLEGRCRQCHTAFQVTFVLRPPHTLAPAPSRPQTIEKGMK